MINGTDQSSAKSSDKQQSSDESRRARLVQLFEKSEEGRDSKIAVQRELGEAWNQYKAQIRRTSGITIERSLREHPLGFTQQHANGCERLYRAYAQYEAANNWYRQSGTIHGWQTTKNSGWEYALQVIALHERSMNGESPDTKPVVTNRKTTRVYKELEDTKSRLSELEHDHSILMKDYSELEQKYLAVSDETKRLGETTQLAASIQVAERDPQIVSPAAVSTEKRVDEVAVTPLSVANQSRKRKSSSPKTRAAHKASSLQKISG